MRKFKLSDSQKLMIFLGGMNVVGKKLGEIEEVSEEEKRLVATDRLKAIEIQNAQMEIVNEKIRELRVQIVDMLNSSGEVKGIWDMFKETPSFIDFNPIIFVMHLPISLQKIRGEEPDTAEVEDFIIVYDGRLVMVTAVCPLEMRPWGVYDMRDRLLRMLKKVVPSFEMTSPCLTHEAIAFVNKPEEVRKDKRDIYLEIRPKKSLVDTLRTLYLRLMPSIYVFYMACEIREKATMVAWEIDDYETKLLLELKEFLATSWRHPLKRTKIVGQMKMYAVKILETLAKYSSMARELKDARLEIEEHRAHNSLFNSFIEKVGIDEYTKLETVDSESIMRIIEHARSETEMYSSSMSILVSTLVGAIIGSALTILVSYSLGIL